MKVGKEYIGEACIDGPTGVAVGTFDGVHLGHQLVVKTLINLCAERGLIPMVITFQPHPLVVIRPDHAPGMLSDNEERIKQLERLGVKLAMLDFTPEIRALDVEHWLETLRTVYDARLVVVGYDNTFGCDGREKTFADYKSIGEKYGLEILQAPVVDDISSTKIREAVSSGDIGNANSMLGHSFSIKAPVSHGREVGRKLGFPTANLNVDSTQLLPAPGVYSADAYTDSGGIYRAVVNIGRAPTFSDSLPMTVEAHLIGFKGDLYGKILRLEFIRRLRSEMKFSDMEALKTAIRQDIEQALRNDRTTSLQ